MKTELSDRVLRYDGVSIVEPDKILNLIKMGIPTSMIRIVSENDDVRLFNSRVEEKDKLKVEGAEPVTLQFEWKLPQQFIELDVHGYVQQLFFEKVNALYGDDEMSITAARRLEIELQEFEKRGLIPLLRTIIYIIHELKANNKIWGVGRGSSCASYVLFILGLHVVDPVLFDVSLEEFFH